MRRAPRDEGRPLAAVPLVWDDESGDGGSITGTARLGLVTAEPDEPADFQAPVDRAGPGDAEPTAPRGAAGDRPPR